MKEAFDTMAEHWCITVWIGIVAIGVSFAIGNLIRLGLKK